MNLKLENEVWEKCIEDEKMADYDNYVSGFSPVSGDITFDTVRVFINKFKSNAHKTVEIYPWVEGETYSAYEHSVPVELKQKIIHLVSATDFYKNL